MLTDNNAVATDAFVGDLSLYVGNGGSPEAFGIYCEVTDLGDIGEKNDQVEVTTLCNGGSKQYIAGLSDGQEFDFTANFAIGDTNQASLIASVKAKENRNFQVKAGADSPQAEFAFNAAMLSWAFAGSTSKQNTIKFTAKISGPIEVT
jgi:hypothetical protein